MLIDIDRQGGACDYQAEGVISNMPTTGGGATSGRSPCAYWPFATSASTLLTVSSVRVELTWRFLVARIAVVAKRKRFSILSPASYTSSDRMIPLFYQCLLGKSHAEVQRSRRRMRNGLRFWGNRNFVAVALDTFPGLKSVPDALLKRAPL